MTDKMTKEPYWLDPCGSLKDKAADTEASEEPWTADLLKHIVNQAATAHSRAEKFKEAFVQKTFNQNVEAFHNLWKSAHYDWLPTIEKNLGEPIPVEHLENLELDNTLLKTYEYLQKIAVGLEQVVWDMRESQNEFEQYFEEAENNLRSLLCEILIALIDRKIQSKIQNVTRDIMKDDVRKMDTTNANMRNWIIYRDYMTVLEYVKDVFGHFQESKS